jgi:hypothetical protein
MNELLTKVYNKLSGEEHSQAIEWAGKVARIIAEKQIPQQTKSTSFASAKTYFKEVIQRAHTRGKIVTSALMYWNTKCLLMDEKSDPRIEAFVQAWNEYVREKAEGNIHSPIHLSSLNPTANGSGMLS